MTAGDAFRIAIVGSGAVAELAHLPAIARVRGCRATLLVDINTARREGLARRFDVPATAADWRAHADAFDGAIVALPHALHADACEALLEAGKAVLVEKPLATTVAEARRIVDAAERTGGVLAVGLMRRYLWSHRFVRTAVAGGMLGAIRRFDIREGSVYDWPVASDAFFRRASSGGGVLADTGAHTLDTLLWWLGDVESVEYRDDAAGGIEADCIADLRMRSGARGVVELSRTRRLRNTAIIEGEHARIEVGIGGGNVLRLVAADGGHALGGRVGPDRRPDERQEYLDLITEQLRAWVAAVRGDRAAIVSGHDALASVELMERCYRTRARWSLPWAEPVMADAR